MSENQETTTENLEDESSEMTIEDTQQQLAEMYLNFLDKNKKGIFGAVTWLGVNLNPLQKDAVEYLTTDAVAKEKTDFFSNIGKNIKKKFVEKFTWWTMLEYNKASLNKMKALITQYKDDQTKLQDLMDKIAAGIDPTETEIPTQTTETPKSETPTNAPATTVEYNDTTGRGKVISAMDALIEKDKDSSIPYVRWWEDVEKEWWLDCSGMVDYILTQAGLNLNIWELKGRNTTKEYFKETWATLVLWKDEATTEEEWLALIKEKDRLKWLKKWDVVIWNSVTEDYQPSWAEMDYNDKKYYLHHIAMIKSVDEDKGTIDILESNGSQWVTESTINIGDRLHWENHKSKASEMYVWKMNYDKYSTNNIVA